MRIAAKRSIAWAAASAGVALAVVLWSRAAWHVDAEAVPGGHAPPAARQPGNGTVPPPAAVTASAAVAEPAQEEGRNNLWSLWSFCPSIWGELTERCMAALEARYADGEAWYNGSPAPLPPRTPITMRQVYADPAATRRIVADALRNPECMVLEGQVRLDLREVCAADAMTKLALLQQRCSAVRTLSSSGRQRMWESVLLNLENDKSLDFDGYHRRRTELDESGFETAWLVRKCRAAESAATAWLPEFPTPHEDWASSHAKGIRDQSWHLISAAARLGSEWALAHTLHGVARINAMAELDLALAYAGRAEKVGQESDRYLPYVQAAHQYGQQRGVPPHKIRLHVGGITEEQWRAAWPETRRMLAQGWEPMVAAEIDAGE